MPMDESKTSSIKPEDWSLPSPEKLRKLEHGPVSLELEVETHRHNLVVLAAWIARRKLAITVLGDHIAQIEQSKARIEAALVQAEESLLRTQRGN
jgi:hypothetical protein